VPCEAEKEFAFPRFDILMVHSLKAYSSGGRFTWTEGEQIWACLSRRWVPEKSLSPPGVNLLIIKWVLFWDPLLCPIPWPTASRTNNAKGAREVFLLRQGTHRKNVTSLVPPWIITSAANMEALTIAYYKIFK